MVFSLSYHFLHDRETAQEVAQEVFLALHRHMAEIESPAHAEYWLRKVAAQRSIDEGRRRKRRPQVTLEAIAEPAAKMEPGDPMLGEVLRRLIGTLPEAPRMVMVMRYQEDLDPTEIAALLEMPLATAKAIYSARWHCCVRSWNGGARESGDGSAGAGVETGAGSYRAWAGFFAARDLRCQAPRLCGATVDGDGGGFGDR